MVYVDNTGAVFNQRPIWTLSGLYYLILSFINFVVLLFRSLIDPNLTKYGSNMEPTHYRTGGGGGNGGSGGGGGGGSGGRFDGPPRAPPRRRMGGFGGSSGGAPSYGPSGCGCG